MNTDDIIHLAGLSRLQLTKQEIDEFPAQFDAILAFVDQIKDADIPDDVIRDMQNYNSFRDDTTYNENGESRQEIIDAFPCREGDYLKVSKVLPN